MGEISTKVGPTGEEAEVVWVCDANRGALRRKAGGGTV